MRVTIINGGLMILCIDVGNSQYHGGVFKNKDCLFQFRMTSSQHSSSDEMGVSLRAVLRENKIDPDTITGISICSVVPDLNHSLASACIKYFKKEPFFLKPGVKTGLAIKYRNPLEVGADRIANAIAATQLYPNKNLIIVDFGTATTVCAVTKTKEYLGGIILPGMRISMEALVNKTAQLPKVEIKETAEVIGRTTVESIQSGLFYGQMGMIRELKTRIVQQAFRDESPITIGTGGFSKLFETAGLFDHLIPTLVLDGLLMAYGMNL